jgi:hypothetical protein
MKKKTTKQSKHTLKKVFATSGTFVGVLAISAALTFFLIPTKVSKAEVNTNSGGNDYIDDNGLSDTDHFMASLETVASKGLSATINGSFNAPSKILKTAATETTAAVYETHDNLISVNGGTLKLVMPSTDELGLNLACPISYNGKSRQLDVTLKDKVVYFSVSNPGASSSEAWDLKYKVDYNEGSYVHNGTTYNTSMGDLDQIGDDIITALGGPDALNVPDSFSTGSVDTTSLMNDLGAMKSVKQNDGSFIYYMTFHLGDVTLPLSMSSTADYDLTSVKLPDYQDPTGQSSVVTFSNNMTAALSVAIDTTSAVTISLPTDAANYHRLVNSLGLFDKIYPLVKSPVFGVSLDSTLSHVVSDAVKDSNGNVTTAEVDETAGLSLTANADLKDIKAPQINADLAFTAGTASQKVAFDYVTDSAKASMAYLNYQNIVKAKMSRLTLDDIVGRITKTTDKLGDDAKTLTQLDNIETMAEKVKLLQTVKDIKDGVSSITSSSLVSGIKEGHYESVLDVIQSISSSDNQIVVTVSLLPAGMKGSIVFTVDATAESLAKIEFQNIAFASFTYNGTLKLTDYASRTVTDSDYSALNHAKTVTDQVLDVVDARQAAFGISGSIMDASNSAIGFDFNGSAEMDVLSSSATYKSGSGSIVINDHKAKYNQSYNIAIDVVKTENMFFTYNSGATTTDSNGNSTPKYLKGRFTIDTLNDMISLIKDLMNTKDERFTRFSDKLTSSISSTILGDVIDNKLNALIENNMIVSSTFGADQSVVVLSKAIAGTSSDITLTISYNSDKTLKDLNISLTTGGKVISVSLSLGTYDGNLQRIASHDTTQFIDFSELAVLMRYGIKTSEINTYHISLTASAVALKVFTIDAISADFYVYVNGATVKMYAKIQLPMIATVNTSYLFGGTRYTTLYYDNNGTTSGVDTVYLYRFDDKNATSWFDETYTRRVEGSEFRKNMTNWIMGFVVGLKDSYLSNISSSTVGDKAMYFENVLKSFTYTAGTNSNPQWVLSLDMGALAGVDALKDLNVTVSGDHDLLTEAAGTLSVKEIVTIDVTFDAKLTNVSAGKETECWVASGTESKWSTYIASHGSDAFSTDYTA